MNTSNPKVSIIIVNFNGNNFLLECLKSIKQSTYKNYEVIIVDNASSDDSIKLAKENVSIPNTKYLILNTNMGFSAANNQAAKMATGDFLFFLNNDTKITPKTLDVLIKTIVKDKNIGITTCKLVSYDGKNTFHSGIGVDILGFPVNSGKTFYAEGSALLINKSLFFKLKGFDNSYFMFHEDIDLCWRTWLLGYKIISTDNTLIYHFAGGTAGGSFPGKEKYKSTILRRYYSERNNIKTLLKNYSSLSLIFILPLYFFLNIFEILLFLILLKPKMAYFYIKAYTWNILNLKDTLLKRKYIQKNRTISDFKLASRMYKGIGKLLMFQKIGLPKFT